MVMDRHLIDKKVTLGIVTLFRVTPWVLMGDRRGLDVLVSIALNDARRFIDGGDYFSLLRGTMQNWLGCLGADVNPDVINAIVGEVTRRVDETIADQYDDGLGPAQGG